MQRSLTIKLLKPNWLFYALGLNIYLTLRPLLLSMEIMDILGAPSLEIEIRRAYRPF